MSKLYILIFSFLLFIPLVSYAQVASTLGESTPLPQYNSGVDQSISAYLCTPTGDGQDLVTCINRLYKFGITTGAVIVLFMFVIAGYLYITSGETGKTKAKQYILNSLVGLGVLMGSYILLYFINPQLTIIKPIQPPIFTAPDLPSCEEIGFEDDCITTGGEVLKGGSSGGQKVPCPDKTLVTIGSLGLPGASSQKICKAFGELLLKTYNSMKPTSWVITSTTTGTHASSCHSEGNEFSGTCADIDYIGNDSSSADSWNKLCRALKSAGVTPHNEVGHDGDVGRDLRDRLADCGSFNKETYAKRDHIHAMWRTGVSGSGSTSGGSTSSSGSRPNCLPVAGIPGVCGNPTNAKYKSGDWSNTKPELKTAYTNLKKKYPSIEAAQVYRSPEYSAYLRSIFEADALINYKWTDAQVRGHGQYCSEKGIQYVTSADAKNPKVATWLSQNRGHISITSPTTCLSDHGQGIALDIDNAPNTRAFEDAAKTLGLCHDVPVYTTKGVTSGKDTRHFALVSAGVKCLNYY